MPTIETIGTGGDYATPQAWYDAHKGDIRSDPNAPYIGELKAETFNSSLTMNASTTDATHYFHLRAQQGAEFKGDFDASYPLLNTLGTNAIVSVQDRYAILEHFVVGNLTTSIAGGTVYGFSIVDGANCILDGLGVYNITYTANVAAAYLHGIRTSTFSNSVMRNCAIGKLSLTNANASGTAYAYGISNALGTNPFLYNNAVHNITANCVNQDAAIGIYSQQATNLRVINNVIGLIDSVVSSNQFCISAIIGTQEIRNNATTDATGGTNGQDNITPANEFIDINDSTLDLHLKVGGQCHNNGFNLIDEDYTGAPLTDCDNGARPVEGAWDIGIDYPYDGFIMIDPTQPIDFSSVVYVPGLSGFVPFLRLYSQCCPVSVSKRLKDRFDNKDYYKRTE